jgi:hypothetical protein
MKALGSFVEGTAAMDAGKYTRRVMKANAVNAERDGSLAAERVRDAARHVRGRQVANMAASGFQVGSGSALDALRESLIESEVEIASIRRTAASQATAQRQQGELAYTAGYNRMSASIISGVAEMMDSATKAAAGGGA